MHLREIILTVVLLIMKKIIAKLLYQIIVQVLYDVLKDANENGIPDIFESSKKSGEPTQAELANLGHLDPQRTKS